MPHSPRAFFGVPRNEARVPGFTLCLLDSLEREIGHHSHVEAHAVLALSGRYVSDASPGDEGPMLIYNPPGTEHGDRFAADRGQIAGRFLGLTIDTGTHGLVDQLAKLPQRAIRVPDPVSAARLRRAWALAVSGDAATILDAEFACLNFLADMAGWTPRAGGAPRWLGLAKAMIAAHRCGALSVGELARVAGVHPVHFARAFRAATGETPGEALRRHQADRAASDIRTGRRPLSEIALDHGYADQSHMTRAFRAVFGVTPAMMRCRKA